MKDGEYIIYESCVLEYVDKDITHEIFAAHAEILISSVVVMG